MKRTNSWKGGPMFSEYYDDVVRQESEFSSSKTSVAILSTEVTNLCQILTRFCGVSERPVTKRSYRFRVYFVICLHSFLFLSPTTCLITTMELTAIPVDVLSLFLDQPTHRYLKRVRLVCRTLHKIVTLRIPRVFLSPNRALGRRRPGYEL